MQFQQHHGLPDEKFMELVEYLTIQTLTEKKEDPPSSHQDLQGIL